MIDFNTILSDEYVEDSEHWKKIKYGLCGNHPFGNLFAPLWLTTNCTCCAFFRGVLTGSLLTASAALVWNTLT